MTLDSLDPVAWPEAESPPEFKDRVIQWPDFRVRTDLTHVDLSGLGLSVFPPEIQALTHLSHLNLSHNRIVTLPEADWACLSRLQSLDLASNGLVALPRWLDRLRTLRRLQLSHNPLGQSGFEAVDLDWGRRACLLHDLDLAQCALTQVPASVFGLQNLQHLRLGDPEYRVRPDICDNFFHALPAELGRLSHLVSISAPNVHLSDLPEAIWAHLTHLRRLDLRHNLLYWLPNGLVHLPSLEVLDLSHNNIESLPYRFETLSTLRCLYLAFNALSWITEDIVDLRGTLKVLDLHHNQLDVEGAQGLAGLALDELDLAGNDLSLAEIHQHLQLADYSTLEANLRRSVGAVHRSAMPLTLDRRPSGLGVPSEEEEAMSSEDEPPLEPAMMMGESSGSEIWSLPSPSSSPSLDRAPERRRMFPVLPLDRASSSLLSEESENWDAQCLGYEGHARRAAPPHQYDFDNMSKYCIGHLEFCPSDVHAKRLPWSHKPGGARRLFEFVRPIRDGVPRLWLKRWLLHLRPPARPYQPHHPEHFADAD